MIRITQKGLVDVINALDPNRLKNASDSAMKQAGELAESDAKQHCADYTGKLKNSIMASYDSEGFTLHAGYTEKGVDVGELNEYGGSPFWNIGTVENPEIYVNKFGRAGYHPFLRPAIQKAARAFPLYFRKKWYRKGIE